MEEEAMAPPHKRRKLSSYIAQHISHLDNSTVAADAEFFQSHSTAHLHAHSLLTAAGTRPEPHDENALQLQQVPEGEIEDSKVLLHRQGSGSSTESPTSTISVNASSNSLASSSTLSSASNPANSITTGVSSSTTGASLLTSATVSSSGGNATLSRTFSASSLSSISLNITTSAIIIIGESTTTLKTTITLGGTSSSPTDSTDNNASLYRATLSNGDISTVTRSISRYTTAFGSETFTVPARTSNGISTALETNSADSSRGGQSTLTSIATVGVAGGAQGSPTYSAPTTSSTAANSNDNHNNSSTPPAGTIAGGVVGGCAGLAVVLLLAMLFVRWYRRKTRMQHQALPPGLPGSPGDGQLIEKSGPGMAERAGLMPLVAAVPGLMRHQKRSIEQSEQSARGFTRVSGRKLPSAYSGGMSSDGPSREPPPPAMPLSSSPPEGERCLSETSFYDGEHGLARSSSSPTSPSSSAPIHGKPPEQMTMSPGPQRQPQVHTGGPYNLTPTTAEIPAFASATAATLGRSETPSSLRNSRFTEQDL